MKQNAKKLIKHFNLLIGNASMVVNVIQHCFSFLKGRSGILRRHVEGSSYCMPFRSDQIFLHTYIKIHTLFILISAMQVVEQEQKKYKEVFDSGKISDLVQFYSRDARYMAPGIPTTVGSGSE